MVSGLLVIVLRLYFPCSKPICVPPGCHKIYFVFSQKLMYHMFSKLFDSQDLSSNGFFIEGFHYLLRTLDLQAPLQTLDLGYLGTFTNLEPLVIICQPWTFMYLLQTLDLQVPFANPGFLSIIFQSGWGGGIETPQNECRYL